MKRVAFTVTFDLDQSWTPHYAEYLRGAILDDVRHHLVGDESVTVVITDGLKEIP